MATEEEVMAVIDAAEAIPLGGEALYAEIAGGSSLFGSIDYEASARCSRPPAHRADRVSSSLGSRGRI